ncbi:MAG: Anthranilate synthase component 1 [Gammaproteobacteria bacterium]|nr:Anthranilate synthase component 1 [Gammaproteobacteria bacterium]
MFNDTPSINADDIRQYAASGFNRIPVMREILADIDTPVSTYLKLASTAYTYLFESVQGGEQWGRYSIIGLPCRTQLSVRDHDVELRVGEEIVESRTVDDPLQSVRQLQSRFRTPQLGHLPRFTGGLVGYFGYDTVRYIEPRLGHCGKADAVGVPDIFLMVSEEVMVFDNLSGRLYLITHVDPAEPAAWHKGNERLDELIDQLRRRQPVLPTAPGTAVDESDFVSSFGEAEFKRVVERSRRYIQDGDIMQVVLSQCLSIPYRLATFDLYRALRTVNPSPYMYYLDLKDFQIVGSSPEILVRLEDGTVTVRPIAGTRHRGRSREEDERLEKELLSDPKELAEHLMLVDLGRNDIGRVAATGSVEVSDRMTIERYSHVMHIVTNVTGQLTADRDAVDVLRAAFPAGTVSGAPKVRAMEIIDELEPSKRGIYSGAVGYIGWNGNMDTAIAIRTAIIKDHTLHVQAGAGIVADSVPELEWKETMNKGRVIFRAVNMVSEGLDGSLSTR